MNNYPLASNTWNEKELQAIESVIDEGIYSMGNYVAKFEKDFATYPVNESDSEATAQASEYDLNSSS